jgi:hypothetical protein
MLKKTVDRYQHGSVRKVKRAQGFAWEFRYYVMEGSVRKPKVPNPSDHWTSRYKGNSAWAR